MKEFSKIIAEAMQNGKTLEQVAQEMTAALNEAQEKQIDPRQEYINKLMEETKETVAKGVITSEAAIKMLTLCAAADRQHWDAEAIKTFQKDMSDSYKTTIALFDGVVKGDSLAKTIGNLLVEAFNEVVDELTYECECNKESKTKADTDSAKLAHFLRELGL